MKSFDIIKYLRKFSALIIVFALAGSSFIYYYGKNHQQYKAVTTIEYKNPGAARGYTPNGELLDPNAIYSAAVVADAITQSKLTEGTGIIRANGYVEPVIPEEDKIRIDALLKEGEESEFIPTTFNVYFVADHTHSVAYARNVLTAVMQSYFEYYSEKYIDQQLINNNIAALDDKQYDYLDQATIIEENVADLLGYLDQKRTNYPDFRSVTTGCSYKDLYGIYDYIYSNEVPKIYSMILNSGSSIDRDLMITSRRAKIEKLKMEIEELNTQAAKLAELTGSLTSKNHEIMDYHYSGDGSNSSPEYILDDVYGPKDSVQKQTTTYDTLIHEYVGLVRDCEHKKIELAYQENILNTFTGSMAGAGDAAADSAAGSGAGTGDAAAVTESAGDAGNAGETGNSAETSETANGAEVVDAAAETGSSVETGAGAVDAASGAGTAAETVAGTERVAEPAYEAVPSAVVSAAEIEQEIKNCTDILNEYFELVEHTSTDLNAKLGAENLEIISSVKVSEAVNIKLYVVVALMFFLIVGVFLAIVVGRLLEFLEYLIYIDRKTDLPNRLRCDQFIAKLANQLLPDNYSCIFLTFDNLAELSREVNREFGDSVLHDFALILKGFYREGSFVGYNGGGKFICFFESLSAGQTRAILQVLKEQVEEHNKVEPSRVIRYSVGFANTSENSIYSIRSLMVAAMNSMQKGL